VKALGLEPPPMMWIFEWDIVTGDSAALDSIYAVSRDQLDAAIAEGERAASVADGMRSLIAGTDPATWRDGGLGKSFVDAVDYEADLLRTLAAYRTTVLRHVQWLDTGTDASYEQWRDAEQSYRAARDEHMARYGGDVDLPAYNFTAADLGAQRADRDLAMAWIARACWPDLLAAVLSLLQLRVRAAGPARPPCATCSWPGAAVALARVAVPTGRFDRILVGCLPLTVLVAQPAGVHLVRAPAHLAVTLGAGCCSRPILRWMVRGQDPYHLWARSARVVLLRSMVLCSRCTCGVRAGTG
jgi:hypothetical protein